MPGRMPPRTGEFIATDGQWLQSFAALKDARWRAKGNFEAGMQIMARNKALKRQKQVQRRNARRKAKRKSLARQKADELALRWQRTAECPIRDVLISEDLWETGIGYVLISREIGPNELAVAVFLLDVFCLGVKDAFLWFRTRGEYRELIQSLSSSDPLVDIDPPCARKLVEEAVDYSGELGFPPHPDYRKARLIFGEIDSGECTQHFQFGKDGKPFFIGGPNDSMAKIGHVMNRLENTCGPHGYDYLIPLDSEFADEDGVLLETFEENEEF